MPSTSPTSTPTRPTTIPTLSPTSPTSSPTCSPTAVWSQVTKVVGTDTIGLQNEQGYSVSLSSDGLTLAVGGHLDNNNIGASYIFKKTAGRWRQVAKLVGTNNIGPSEQGFAVSLSSDGLTLAVGGPNDDQNRGATWLFTNTTDGWSQVAKLIGSGNAGGFQGYSVSLSSDGLTLAVGGPYDNIGAAWIFKSTTGGWNQVAKLTGTGNVGQSEQARSVSLSSDGLTLAVGGNEDDSAIGATWIFKNTAGAWTQVAKLVATGNIGKSFQGYSVSLSYDGLMLAVGGPLDDNAVGAAFIFKNTAGAWTQVAKLTGDGNIGQSFQGKSVSLSSDGLTLAMGGPSNDNDNGGTWLFKNTAGAWSEVTTIVGQGNVGPANQGRSVSLSSDGLTLAVGGSSDNSSIGASFIFDSIYPCEVSQQRVHDCKP